MHPVILRAAIPLKAFRTLTAFAASGLVASSTDARIGVDSTRGSRQSCRLPATAPLKAPASADDATSRNSSGQPRIAACSRLTAHHSNDAIACHADSLNPNQWSPQFSLHLTPFRDIFFEYLRVLLCAAPSRTAVPGPSL